MILDQLFEAVGENSTAQQVAEVLRQTHPNPSEATEREILAATGRVLSDQGMSAVRVRFYLRDPDFQSDIIEAVQALLLGVSEKIDLGPRLGTKRDQGKILRKMRQSRLGEQGVGEAMKPSDIPPSMRQRLTMRDVEAERPAGAFRFRVVTPQGDAIDFMDQSAAEQRARAMGGRVEPIDPQPQGLPGRNRFRVQDPQGSRPAATFQDRKSAERYAAAKKLPVEVIPEAKGKKAGARIERILQMLRARHPQAKDDLEALIFDFRSQQSQDRSDIARLDAENDAEEADIQRLERMLDLIKRRRGVAAEPAATNESLRDGEYHVATVTLDDGTVKKVRITSDEGFRDQITNHFRRQGRTVKDIDVDYSVRSELDETKKKPQPTNPELWSRAKSAARSKFDVYPSAYANAWAAKWYKSKGGGWRMGKPKKD